MARYTTAEALIGGNPAQLSATADILAASADTADDLATALRRSADDTDATWRGKAGVAYRAKATQQVGTIGKLPASLSTAASAYRALAGELSAAQQRAGEALHQASAIGLPQGALFGNPVETVRQHGHLAGRGHRWRRRP